MHWCDTGIWLLPCPQPRLETHVNPCLRLCCSSSSLFAAVVENRPRAELLGVIRSPSVNLSSRRKDGAPRGCLTGQSVTTGARLRLRVCGDFKRVGVRRLNWLWQRRAKSFPQVCNCDLSLLHSCRRGSSRREPHRVWHKVSSRLPVSPLPLLLTLIGSALVYGFINNTDSRQVSSAPAAALTVMDSSPEFQS